WRLRHARRSPPGRPVPTPNRRARESMRTTLAALVAVLWLPGIALAQATADAYQRDVRPLVNRRCVACHGALKQKAGLRLDTAARMLRGGDSGPAIEPGKSGESLIVEAISGSEGWRMPPEGEGEPLSAAEIAGVK